MCTWGDARKQLPTSNAAMASPFRGIRDDPSSGPAPTDAISRFRLLRGDAATPSPSDVRGVGRIGAGIRASLWRRRPLALPLLLFAVALPPLMLATWGFGRMLSASEVSKLDLRLSEVVSGEVSTAKSETDRANAVAETLARSTAVQDALQHHDKAALRSLTASRHDVAIVLPGGEGQVGLLPPGPNLVRRIDVLAGGVRLGTVIAAVRLAPLLMGR